MSSILLVLALSSARLLLILLAAHVDWRVVVVVSAGQEQSSQAFGEKTQATSRIRVVATYFLADNSSVEM